MKKQLLAFTLTIASFSAFAQENIQLQCPLNDAIMKDFKEVYNYASTSEPKMVVTSATDSTVKAVFDGKVKFVQGEGGFIDVVLFTGNYFVWLSGMNKATVKVGQAVKAGDPIGIISPGKNLDITLFKQKTALPIKEYMSCATN